MFDFTVARRGGGLRVADDMMTAVFDNDNIHHILHGKRRDCVPTVEQQRHPHLTSIPAQLVQRRLRWLGPAARRSFAHTAPHVAQTNCRPAEDASKAYLESLSEPRVFGCGRWRKDRVKASTEDRRAWGASIQDAVNSIGDASLTHPKYCIQEI